MDGCVARWAGEKLLQAEEDPFGAAPLGSAAHELFEEFYKLLPPLLTKATAEAMLQAAADKQWPVFPDMSAEVAGAILENRKRWVEEVRLCYAGIFKLEEPAKVRVLAVELKLDNMIVRGVPFGFMGRVS
jgi:putative RecB family exonuclease